MGTVVGRSVGRFRLFGLAAGAVAAAALAPATGAQAAETVKLSMDWIINGTHAGYFVAAKKGFYTDAGLDVEISRGYGSGDTVKRVGVKSATIGVNDTGALIAGRANSDIPVKAVFMVYGQAALGIIYLEESGIKSPKDLEGKTLARSAKGASVVMLPGFLNANNVDRSKVNEIVVDGATMLPLLLTRKADAVTEQSMHLGRFQSKAGPAGLHAKAMRYSEHGLTAYGNAITVHDDTIKENPEMVRKFLCATKKGMDWAFKHKKEAIDIVREKTPDVDLTWGVEELEQLEQIAWSPEAKANGLGAIDEKKMAATIDTVTSALQLPKKVATADVYTAKLIPAKDQCN